MVAIYGFDGGISIYDALNFVLIFETMERDNAASPARRRRRRVEPSSSATQQSKHPSASTVDATQFSIDDLRTLLDVPGFADRIDFVNLPKASIDALFVTPCICKKSGGRAKLLFPPKSHRRTLGQIQDWFKCGNGQRRNLVTASDLVDIIPSPRADHLYWDGAAWRLRHPLIQSVAPRCSGFTRQYMLSLSDMRYDQASREKLELGLLQTFREGMSNRVEASRPSCHTWRHPSSVVGELWMLKDTNDVRCIVVEEKHTANENQFDFMAIRDKECLRGLVAPGHKLCKKCKSRWRYVKEKCIANVEIRENIARGGFHPHTNRNILARSASLQKQHADYHKRMHQNKLKKAHRMEKVVSEMIDKNGLVVHRNKYSDAIFSKKNQEKVLAKLETELGPDSICAYAFVKSCDKHRIAAVSGANQIKHCPLMVRFGATVRQAMGDSGGLYDLVAKVAGFPSSRHLARFTTTNSNDPDGIMHGNCRRARSMFDSKYPDAHRFAYSRHVNVAFDGMHVKGRFGVSRNTNEIVGMQENALDEDVLRRELKRVEKNSIDADSDADKKIDLPGLAAHFVVFIATTWSCGRKIRFLAARFGRKSVTGIWVQKTIIKLLVSLAAYGFIGDTISGDGASENRSAFRMLSTISAKSILEQTWTKEELKGIDADFKMAFEHPHPLYRKRVTVVIGGEMPHWVKKFRNAFDNKSRCLVFRGKKMSLLQIYNIWKASGDADVKGGAGLRLYKFTHDHFNLNAFSKMRVFLAVQFTSQTAIKMIKDHCEHDPVDTIKEFEPMIELLNLVDRLIDIMNGIDFSKGKKRNVSFIDKPRHRHVAELFDILRVFAEWRGQCKGKGNSSKFITYQTFDDLRYMVFGIAAHASLFLKDDKSNVMRQERHGTDCCEHFFSKCRYINSNPTMQQQRENASLASSGLGMDSEAFRPNNKGNSGTANSDVTFADLMVPLDQPNKKRRIK